MRVLVVEDDKNLADAICQLLSSTKGMMVPTHAENGMTGVQMLKAARSEGNPFAAVVLDLTLPDIDGLDVLRGLRAADDLTPVIILTARGGLSDKVEGLEQGADDYMAKPFDDIELIARLRTITRRGGETQSNVQRVGNLSFEVSRAAFAVDNARLTLQPRMHAILQLLVRRAGQNVSKDVLCNLDLKGMSYEAVDKQMSRLRLTLRDAGASVSIVSNKGMGYMLTDGQVQ